MNVILQILILTLIIIITITLIIRYFKIYKTPDCSTKIRFQTEYVRFNYELREWVLRSIYEMKIDEIYGSLIKRIEGISSAFDEIHPGSYHDIRYHIKKWLTDLNKYINARIKGNDTADIKKEMELNAKNYAGYIKGLNRQYDVDVLDKYLIDNSILITKHIDVLVEQKGKNISTINEHNKLMDNIFGFIDYIIDPPKRWPVYFFDV